MTVAEIDHELLVAGVSHPPGEESADDFDAIVPSCDDGIVVSLPRDVGPCG